MCEIRFCTVFKGMQTEKFCLAGKNMARDGQKWTGVSAFFRSHFLNLGSGTHFQLFSQNDSFFCFDLMLVSTLLFTRCDFAATDTIYSWNIRDEFREKEETGMVRHIVIFSYTF